MEAVRQAQLDSPPQPEVQSYMDYMMAVRNFSIREWFPQVAQDIAAQAEEQGLPGDVTVDEYESLAPSIDKAAEVQAWKRVMRSQQQMTWQRLVDAYSSDRARWLALLDEAEKVHPGHLHITPDLEVPESACLDIHLQPGGYCRDPLAGYLFDHGTRVFYQGDNEGDSLHKAYVNAMRVPEDGKVETILDLGCSIGQCTTALKERFPGAEVWGLDIALPLLRYAHLRATTLHIDVHFKQGLAEKLDFDDNSCDCVFAYILFHETPEHTFEPILREAFRVLRPGGTLTIVDAPNNSKMPAANRMWLAFDARYNCEPFSPAFVATDLVALLEKVGFGVVEHGPTPTFLSQTKAAKPG